jgi:ribosomal protein S18 acetylase RimI-like enzyme
MTACKEKSTRCTFLRRPRGDQIRQLIDLYRAERWWQASDDAREDLIRKLITGSHCFVIAQEGMSIIGMGRAISDGISDAYIQDLTVRIDRRKQGIGGAIVQKIVERLHADGIFWIGLIAAPGSANLYKGSGFNEMCGSTPMLMIKER